MYLVYQGISAIRTERHAKRIKAVQKKKKLVLLETSRWQCKQHKQLKNLSQAVKALIKIDMSLRVFWAFPKRTKYSDLHQQSKFQFSDF